ncbi:MAG: hypothetical protein UY05_C0038G0003 [Candidatus Peregrinibacteria bacterium GW2011_GWA2_47_7]|nr:MAG: hypothetical protein UY05_C0038G0003 [Candidatus Peregrinibacteria bacterium GW2011_GWA2_47_7]
MLARVFFKNYVQDDEQVFLVIHKHLFFITWKVFKILFFGVLLPALLWLLFPKLFFICVLWAWSGLVALAYEFVKWYYDAWLVTDCSIVVIDWNGFFDKSSTRVEYHLTDEVGYEIKGFFPTIFNYGIITLVRGVGSPLVFASTWRPKDKVAIMLQYQDQFMRKKNFRDHKTLKGMLADMLHLHQTRDGVDPVKIEEKIR